MKIIVYITDTNDNSPKFTHTSFTGKVAESAPFGDLVSETSFYFYYPVEYFSYFCLFHQVNVYR